MKFLLFYRFLFMSIAATVVLTGNAMQRVNTSTRLVNLIDQLGQSRDEYLFNMTKYQWSKTEYNRERHLQRKLRTKIIKLIEQYQYQPVLNHVGTLDDNTQITPLELAALYGDLIITKALLVNGVHPTWNAIHRTQEVCARLEAKRLQHTETYKTTTKCLALLKQAERETKKRHDH